jgi:hypothetical protein
MINNDDFSNSNKSNLDQETLNRSSNEKNKTIDGEKQYFETLDKCDPFSIHQFAIKLSEGFYGENEKKLSNKYFLIAIDKQYIESMFAYAY